MARLNGSWQENDSLAVVSGEDEAYTHSYTRPSRVATLSAASVMTAFWLFGVVANVLLIGALSVREIRKKRGTVNVIYVFIVSMAANDLLNLSTNQTFVILSYAGHRWLVGAPHERACQLSPELNMFLVATNMWHQTLIALHRYIVVVRSQWYLRINKTVYSLLVIIATRVVPLAQSLPLVLSGEAFSSAFYDPKLLRCVFKSEYKTRTMLVFLSGFVVPCVLVVMCFTLIFVFVRRASRRAMFNARKSRAPVASAGVGAGAGGVAKGNDAPLGLSPVAERKSAIATIVQQTNRLPASIALACPAASASTAARLYQRELQITKMFGVVFLVIVLGFVPYGLIRNADARGSLPADAYVVVTALYAVASCLPPLIYGLMNQDVRWIVLAFLCRKRCAGPKAVFERTYVEPNGIRPDSLPTGASQMLSLKRK